MTTTTTTEQLPPQPTVTLGKDTKQHPQVWFTWDDTQAYARAAIAADRVSRTAGGEVVAWIPPAPVIFEYDKKNKPEKYAAYTVGQLHDAYVAGKRTSPTAPDAIQAEQAAMLDWLLERVGVDSRGRCYLRVGPKAPPNKIESAVAIRTAMTKDAPAATLTKDSKP